MMGGRLAALLALTVVSADGRSFFLPLAHGEGGTELAIELEARVLKTAETELGRIERLLRAQPGINSGAVANLTLELQTALEEDLGRGPIKLHPRAIFDVCLEKLKKGADRDAIGRELVAMQRRGDFARYAAGGAVDVGGKKVASFVFDKERLRSPDPHLPDTFKPPQGSKLKGVYQICVGTDGKVSKVSVVQSLSGADQAVMDQIQSTWQYKPQPVPVCTTRAFVFQFN